MENSKIQWTDHTMNFWMGCQKVTDACKFCYAETFSQRYHGKDLWGPNSRRHITTSTWGNPAKWNKQADEMGLRYKVFASSLSDFFEDNDQVVETRIKAWKIIKDTPHLDWLILTKRPENIRKFLPEDWGSGYENVWLGTSIGSQKDVHMITKLMQVPAVCRFLSCEPLIGPLDITNKGISNGYSVPTRFDGGSGIEWTDPGDKFIGIDWVIVGGESGMKKDARAFNIEWARKIKRDCEDSDTAFFMKQLGANPVYPSAQSGKLERMKLTPHDRKGDDFEMFPTDLKVRQFPKFRRV
jgi:protein gp37